MAPIGDGIGPTLAPSAVPARREAASPPRPSGPVRARVRPAGAGDVGRFGALGRVFEERGRQWAEAVRLHQLDRRLGRLAERVGELRVRLDWVKLYPPYPPDEPRRAAAIRQFNGIAAEVRRMVHQSDSGGDGPERLPPTASTEQAEKAVAALSRHEVRLRDRLAQVRAELAERWPEPSEAEAAAEVAAVSRRLAPVAGAGLAGGAARLLREL